MGMPMYTIYILRGYIILLLMGLWYIIQARRHLFSRFLLAYLVKLLRARKRINGVTDGRKEKLTVRYVFQTRQGKELQFAGDVIRLHLKWKSTDAKLVQVCEQQIE